MSKLLIQEQPLLLLPKLAAKIGLNETIFIQQLHYWLQTKYEIRDGHRWFFCTYDNWKLQFPFWSTTTIRRIVSILEEKNLIITGNYNHAKNNKTKWYRINYEELLQFSDELSDHLTTESCLFSTDEESQGDCPLTFDQFEQYDDANWPHGGSQNDQANFQNEQIDLSNLGKSRKETIKETKQQQQLTDLEKEKDETNPFTFFEQNGFGTIGGYLSEKIIAWCQDLSEELVVEAMKYAVENGTKHWRYVEGILRHWAERGYQHVHEVHADQKAYKERILKKSSVSGRTLPKTFQLNLSAGEDE